ncbi:MAG TPA: aldehyde dehydrogenase family protein, partial [Verrucomicrobiae bacterium]|nr:aldehyde dehydrogenase family protein [Verrucomicrobiae bacterium]
MTPLLKKLGLAAENPGVFDGEWTGSGPILKSISPIDGKILGAVRTATAADYERAVQRAQRAF